MLWIRLARPSDFRNESLEDLKRVPIAFFEDDGPVTAETHQAVRDAARALEHQGFSVKPFRRERSRKRGSCGGNFLSAAGPCFSIRWYGEGTTS